MLAALCGAAAWADEPPSGKTSEKSAVATALEQAEVWREVGDVAAWRGALEKALAAARAAGEARGEAQACGALGVYFTTVGQPAPALANHERALEIFRAAGDKKGEAQTLLKIGHLVQSGGQPAAALERYREALKIFRSLGDGAAEASALSSVGFAYQNLGQPETAIAYLQQALDLYRAEEPRDKAREANTLTSLSLVYRDQHYLTEALRYSEEALALRRALNDRPGMAEIMESQGDLHFQLGGMRQAISLTSQALQSWRNLGDRGHEMGALANLSAMEEHDDQRDTAMTHLRQALEIAEGPREALGALGANEVSETKRVAYGQMVKLLAQNQPEEAFLWAQRGKAAMLRDALFAAETEPAADATPGELERESALRRRVIEIRGRWMLRARQGRLSGAERRDAEYAEADLEDFQIALYQKYPRLAQLRAATGARLSEVPKFLPEDTALLEFAPAAMPWEDGLVLFCVTAGRGRATVTAHLMGDLRVALPALVENFRGACADLRRDAAFAGPELYELLLADAAPRFHQKKRLLICPTGPLWGLPFQALPDENGVPLAQRFEIAYAPSATAARAALDTPPGATPPGATPRRSMLIAGTAPAQAAAIKSVFPDAMPLAPNTSPTVADAVADARLLHIAAPLRLDDAAPFSSGWELSGGTLTARQLMEMKLAARLAVLSPPGDPLAKNSGGKGLAALHHALMSAGVSAQVTAQWAVPDARAAAFFKAFYAHLKSGQSAGAALRSTVAALRANPRTAHPAHWAPFILIGDWRRKM